MAQRFVHRPPARLLAGENDDFRDIARAADEILLICQQASQLANFGGRAAADPADGQMGAKAAAIAAETQLGHTVLNRSMQGNHLVGSPGHAERWHGGCEGDDYGIDTIGGEDGC